MLIYNQRYFLGDVKHTVQEVTAVPKKIKTLLEVKFKRPLFNRSDRTVSDESFQVVLGRHFQKPLLVFFCDDICCLSALFLSLHPACDTIHQVRSTDIWKFCSLSLKEINSGFRWFSCLFTCDSWLAVRVSWPSSPSSPPGLPASPWARSESSSLHLHDSYHAPFFLSKIS